MFGKKEIKNFELNPEEEEIFEKNISWLFGNARGGTTWVALQLLSHNTISINEPHIEEHLSVRAVKDKKASFARIIDNPHKNPDYFFSQEYKNVWLRFLKKLILNRFYSQTKDIEKKVIIKEPCAIGATDVLTQCMPNSKSIILLRDGRDVLDSIYDAQTKNGFMIKADNRKPITERMEFLEKNSRLWAHRTEHFLETYNNLPSNLRYIVKYEDILANTTSELEKIYKFLEIKITKEEIEKIVTKYDFDKIPAGKKGSGKFHRSASPGKWKDHFNQEEQELMNEIMENTLKKAGYRI